MNIQFIRNATMILTYAGKIFLTDPMLSEKGAIRSFAGIAPNPTQELVIPAAEIAEKAEYVIISHTHPDHYDSAAETLLRKDIPVFCPPKDKETFTKAGFQNIIAVDEVYHLDNIDITRTRGQHGSGEMLEYMGTVSGFVLQAPGEPTVYWVGDSIWCEEVEKNILRFKPDIIITHSGGAQIPGHDPIIMDAPQTLALLNAAPDFTVVAIHMESLDHCMTTRTMLRESADKAKILRTRLLIPIDGETLEFENKKQSAHTQHQHTIEHH